MRLNRKSDPWAPITRTPRQRLRLMLLRIGAELLLAPVRDRIPGIWTTQQVLRYQDTSLVVESPTAVLGCRLLVRWNRLNDEYDGMDPTAAAPS